MHKNSLQEEVTNPTTKKDFATKTVKFTTKNSAYDFPLRYNSLKSLPATFLLLLGILNYFFSYSFKNGYKSYQELLSLPNSDLALVC